MIGPGCMISAKGGGGGGGGGGRPAGSKMGGGWGGRGEGGGGGGGGGGGHPVDGAGAVVGDVDGAVRTGQRHHRPAPPAAVSGLEPGEEGLLRAERGVMPGEERPLGRPRGLPVPRPVHADQRTLPIGRRPGPLIDEAQAERRRV